MRQSILFHGCGAGIAVLCAALSVDSFFMDPAGETAEILLFMAIIGGMAVFYGLALWQIVRGRTNAGLGGVLAWAVIFRLLLLPSLPILDSSCYRHLWDGYVLSKGFNPFQFAPGEILDQKSAAGLKEEDAQILERLRSLTRRVGPAQDVLHRVDHPQLNTIHLPFAQIMFGVSAVFFPLSMLGWRILILFFDAALILALTALLSRFGRDPRCVLIYAWSPLALKETVNSLHVDVIASAGLFIGILFAMAGYKKRSPIAWACAAMTQLYPIIVAPIWSKKWTIRSWSLFGAILIILLFLFSGAGVRGASGLADFANQWESNSSVVAALEAALEWLGAPSRGEGSVLFTFAGAAFRLNALLSAKLAGVLIVLGIALSLAWKSMRQEIGDACRLQWTFGLVGAVILCSPVCNPWHIAWIVPFLCFTPRLSWLYLSLACFAYYSYFIPDPRGIPPGVRVLEYAPFFALLIWEWKFALTNRFLPSR
ncbi:MAG: hypothetical protein JXR73_08950 [Candidatus Omnitrophica bacterium]|nr:hypothetical protein [Candidatus Omnitrophota bacterium]